MKSNIIYLLLKCAMEPANFVGTYSRSVIYHIGLLWNLVSGRRCTTFTVHLLFITYFGNWHSTSELDHSDAEQNDHELFWKLVQFHNSVKEWKKKFSFSSIFKCVNLIVLPWRWFLQSAKVYSLTFVIQLIFNKIFLSVTVFQLDLVIRTRTKALHIDFPRNWDKFSFELSANEIYRYKLPFDCIYFFHFYFHSVYLENWQ